MATFQLDSKRFGDLPEDRQQRLAETLADIDQYRNITEQQREVCRQNAVMTAHVEARLRKRDHKRPLAKVLEFPAHRCDLDNGAD